MLERPQKLQQCMCQTMVPHPGPNIVERRRPPTSTGSKTRLDPSLHDPVSRYLVAPDLRRDRCETASPKRNLTGGVEVAHLVRIVRLGLRHRNRATCFAEGFRRSLSGNLRCASPCRPRGPSRVGTPSEPASDRSAVGLVLLTELVLHRVLLERDVSEPRTRRFRLPHRGRHRRLASQILVLPMRRRCTRSRNTAFPQGHSDRDPIGRPRAGIRQDEVGLHVLLAKKVLV